MILDVKFLIINSTEIRHTCHATGDRSPIIGEYLEILKSNKYTQKMKSLEPDVEEQALLAGISMFSPFLRNVRDHDDIHLLSKIQVSKNWLKCQNLF